jgi:hypothetical protein
MGCLRMYTSYNPETDDIKVFDNIGSGSEGYIFGFPHAPCTSMTKLEKGETGFYRN